MKDERELQSDRMPALTATHRLEGSVVYDPEGQPLAALDDLLVDAATGEVRFALVLPNEPGDAGRLVPVPWEALQFDEAREGYQLAADRNTFHTAPSLAAGEVVDWTDQSWGARVRTHFASPQQQD